MRGARGGPDRYVKWKLGLFFLGAGFLVAGMATGRNWPVAVSIAVLAAGVLVRFLPGLREEEGE
jgi:uncharacterized membrane protein YjjP (DUF1212 family)